MLWYPDVVPRMPKIALTDRFCSTAQPPNGRVDYFDVTVRGLALRVTENGHRSWCFHYRSPRDGRRARATIGSYPATSLAAARGKALEVRTLVEAGRDPRAGRNGQIGPAAAMDVAALVAAYMADPNRAALRSRHEIERRLRRNVIPVIGAVKLDELRRRDVRNVSDQIMKRGRRIEANRTFCDVRSMIRWALEREYLENNPIDGMTKPADETLRDRVLNDDEIRTLWSRLPEALQSVKYRRIIMLCLVTAQRVGEVAGLVPAELDLVAREWRLPGSRAKNAHAHIVPLSDLAITIIEEAMADSNEKGPLFPSASSKSVAQAILRANKDGRFGIAPWSAHDLRRTALTGMARLSVAPIVLGHVANHRTTTRAGVTLAVYSQYAYDKEKRQALELWADRLLAITGAGAVADVSPFGRPA
jgi:integrase